MSVFEIKHERQESVEPNVGSDKLREKIKAVSILLKGVNHPIRLYILSQLVIKGESNVTDLVETLHASQSSVSQHLAKMRNLHIVSTRKVGKQVIYRIEDPFILDIMNFIFEDELKAYREEKQ